MLTAPRNAFNTTFCILKTMKFLTPNRRHENKKTRTRHQVFQTLLVLSIYNKLLTYSNKQVLKPVWTYGVSLYAILNNSG